MDQKVREISEKHFRTKYEQLGEREKKVARHLADRSHISRNVVQDFAEQLTFGQRLADKVAAFGGSWTFISIFAIVLWLFGFSSIRLFSSRTTRRSIRILIFC